MILKRWFHPIKVAAYVWREVSVSLLVATGIYIAHTQGSYTGIALNTTVLSILGVALSIFLGFRANTSFGRWSEAAQAWASIHATARSLARITITFVDSHRGSPTYTLERAEAFKRLMVLRIVAWVHALRFHLRGPGWVLPADGSAPPGVPSSPAGAKAFTGATLDDEALRVVLAPLLDADELDAVMTQPNKPVYLLFRHGQQIYDGMANGTLQGFDAFQMEGHLASLTSYLTVCERLKVLPIPQQYSFFTSVFVFIFCTMMPFMILRDLISVGVPWAVIPISGTVAFLYNTIERTAEVNETPFANRITDVPLTYFCMEVERDLKIMLAGGGADSAAALPPREPLRNGYLW